MANEITVTPNTFGGLRQIYSLPAPAGQPNDAEIIPERMPEFWPRPHQTPEIPAAAQVRDNPYVLRGRDHEIAWMASRLGTMPRPVQLIEGPPGSGKTSLLATVGYYAAAQNRRVIRLDHSAFASNVSLARALDAPHHPADGIPNSTIVTDGEASHTGYASTGTGAQANTARTHSHDEATTWQNAILREAARPGHEGFIILLDEVQELRRTPGDRSSDTEWGRIHAFLQWMHNEPVKAGGGIRAMLICAGLQNASDVLREYGLTRIEGEDILGMGPIADDAAGRIIDDHMAAERHDGRTLPKLPAHARAKLIEVAGGFAHHISHAAQKAQAQAMVAQQAGRTELSGDDIDAILQGTRNAKRRHYQGRVDENGGTKNLQFAAELCAQATENWGQAMPEAAVIDLIKRFERASELPRGTLTGELTRKGILERRTATAPFPTAATDPTPHWDYDAGHYVLPIPSMRTWLLDRLDERDHDGTVRQENRALIESVRPTINPPERIPEWHWQPRKPLPVLTRVPADQPWVAGRPAVDRPSPIDIRTVRHTTGTTVHRTATIVRGTGRAMLKQIWDGANVAGRWLRNWVKRQRAGRKN